MPNHVPQPLAGFLDQRSRIVLATRLPGRLRAQRNGDRDDIAAAHVFGALAAARTRCSRWPGESGIGGLRGVVSSPAIRRAHTVNAPEEPVNPVGRLSS